jgi:hypothetical protein
MATIDGVNAVLIDHSMAAADARLYDFMIDFAMSNALQVENLPG